LQTIEELKPSVDMAMSNTRQDTHDAVAITTRARHVVNECYRNMPRSPTRKRTRINEDYLMNAMEGFDPLCPASTFLADGGAAKSAPVQAPVPLFYNTVINTPASIHPLVPAFSSEVTPEMEVEALTPSTNERKEANPGIDVERMLAQAQNEAANEKLEDVEAVELKVDKRGRDLMQAETQIKQEQEPEDPNRKHIKAGCLLEKASSLDSIDSVELSAVPMAGLELQGYSPGLH